MRLNELEKKEPSNVRIEVEQIDSWTDGGDDEYDIEIQYTEYEITINGNIVGTMTHSDYYGNLVGTIGKRNVDLNHIGDSAQEALERYFSSRTGQKHLELLNV